MELRHLKYFVKIAETLNFSEAAKSLFITQSTLSQQIRQLEQEVDAQLFERNNHNVRLTEAGEELLPYARQTLKASQACFDRIQDLQQMLTGTLNIGVTFSFSPILTEALFAFIKLYPKVKLNIFYKPMAELMKMLEQDEVDFALTFRPAELNKDIESYFCSIIIWRSSFVRTIRWLRRKVSASPNWSIMTWYFLPRGYKHAMPSTSCVRDAIIISRYVWN